MLVKFFATYRQIAGAKSIELPAPATVLELLDSLSLTWPEFRPLLLNDDKTGLGPDAIVLVSGRHIDHLQGVDTPLSESDYVAITPLVAGG